MAKLSKAGRDALPSQDFAEPAERAFPIEDKAHARNAKARAAQGAKAGRISAAEASRIEAKADKVLKKK